MYGGKYINYCWSLVYALLLLVLPCKRMKIGLRTCSIPLHFKPCTIEDYEKWERGRIMGSALSTKSQRTIVTVWKAALSSLGMCQHGFHYRLLESSIPLWMMRMRSARCSQMIGVSLSSKPGIKFRYHVKNAMYNRSL